MLALLAAHGAMGEAGYLATAEEVFARIRPQWDGAVCGGGVWIGLDWIGLD